MKDVKGKEVQSIYKIHTQENMLNVFLDEVDIEKLNKASMWTKDDQVGLVAIAFGMLIMTIFMAGITTKPLTYGVVTLIMLGLYFILVYKKIYSIKSTKRQAKVCVHKQFSKLDKKSKDLFGMKHDHPVIVEAIKTIEKSAGADISILIEEENLEEMLTLEIQKEISIIKNRLEKMKAKMSN